MILWNLHFFSVCLHGISFLDWWFSLSFAPEFWSSRNYWFTDQFVFLWNLALQYLATTFSSFLYLFQLYSALLLASIFLNSLLSRTCVMHGSDLAQVRQRLSAWDSAAAAKCKSATESILAPTTSPGGEVLKILSVGHRLNLISRIQEITLARNFCSSNLDSNLNSAAWPMGCSGFICSETPK